MNEHDAPSGHAGPDRAAPEFWIARNPNPASRLPYLLWLPVSGRKPLVLATSGPWPGPKDLFCLELPEWPKDAEVVERAGVEACWQAGKAVHLVLRRRQRRRSMFVWTESKGRSMVFWRTQKTMQTARPGLKVPQARRLDIALTVAVDIRERYPWRFAQKPVRPVRRELPVGDYAVVTDDRVYAAVERKSPGGLATSAVDGTLAFVLAELSRLPRAVLVVEGRFSDVLKSGSYVNPSWLMSVAAALQWMYPQVPWVFAETRALAEEYAYRWLAAAHKALTEPRAPLYEPARRPTGTQLALETHAGDGFGFSASRATPAVRDRQARLAAALQLADGGRAWTTAAYAAHFGVSQSTAGNDLRLLVRAGALKPEGTGSARRYGRPAQKE
ncbi:MAG: ERCC4 domain-containing protein [Firmicutes bacterium]|nr:ERCC4 domain-containing protein [Bacillota bacterium]